MRLSVVKMDAVQMLNKTFATGALEVVSGATAEILNVMDKIAAKDETWCGTQLQAFYPEDYSVTCDALVGDI